MWYSIFSVSDTCVIAPKCINQALIGLIIHPYDLEGFKDSLRNLWQGNSSYSANKYCWNGVQGLDQEFEEGFDEEMFGLFSKHS